MAAAWSHAGQSMMRWLRLAVAVAAPLAEAGLLTSVLHEALHALAPPRTPNSHVEILKNLASNNIRAIPW